MCPLRRVEKSCRVDPLRMSRPFGAAMAFLGLAGGVPLLLGSRGCSTVGLVFLVRHFQEAIAFETVDVDEVSTVLGCRDELEKALLSLHARLSPSLVGVLSTTTAEARGEDVRGELALIRRKHAGRPGFADMETVWVSAPDFSGAFQDGWSEAVQAVIERLVRPSETKKPRRVNVLAGHHLTPGDVEEIKESLEAFGLEHVVLPDISGPLSVVTTHDEASQAQATSVEDVRSMGESAFTLAIGEHMRSPAQAIERLAGVPFRVFDRLTGLAPCDEFIALLSALSGIEAPPRFRRQRARLLHAMLSCQPAFEGRRAALALDPDLLLAYCALLGEMGADIQAAVADSTSPVLARVPAGEVLLGDMEDLEAAACGADILIAPSSAARVAEKLGVAHKRAGLPVTDRLGAAQAVSVGYQGTGNLVFELANILLDTSPRSLTIEAAGPGQRRVRSFQPGD